MITVVQIPNLIEPASSTDGANLAIIADSDNSAFCSFKYLAAVSINDTPISVLKVSPNLQDGLGILSANRVIEDFLSYDLHGPTAGFSLANQSLVKWSIELGEETDGTLDCTGTTYLQQFGPTVTGWAWNGALQPTDTWTYADFYQSTGGTGIRFLTNGPNRQRVKTEDSSFLYFLSGIAATAHLGPTAPPNGYPICLKINTVSATGASQNWFMVPSINIEVNKMYSIGVGPALINNQVTANQVFSAFGTLATGTIIDCSTRSYSVELTNYELVG